MKDLKQIRDEVYAVYYSRYPEDEQMLAALMTDFYNDCLELVKPTCKTFITHETVNSHSLPLPLAMSLATVLNRERLTRCYLQAEREFERVFCTHNIVSGNRLIEE